MAGRHQKVAHREDQVAGAAIADRKLVPGPQAVEHRQSGPVKGNVKSRCRLAAVRVRDQKIAVDRAALKVLQVADQHLGQRQRFQQRRLRGGDGTGDLGAHFAQPHAERIEQIRFGSQRDPLAAEVEMPVEHGILQLAALAAVLGRHRHAAQGAQVAQQAVVGVQASQAVEHLERHPCPVLQFLGTDPHLFADSNRGDRAGTGRHLVQRGPAHGGGAELVGHVTVE